MRSEFSEFSYGYAVTEELINWHGVGLRAVPYFPNQVREGRGFGYDLRLDRPGAPLFLQFKLADGMERKSASEIKTHRLPLTPTFYRMPISRRDRSSQHLRLAMLDDAGAEVYYVAPRFHKTLDFSTAYFSRRVVERSVFIRPKSIGLLPDDKQHHVSYPAAGPRGWFCSEPRELEEIFSGETIADEVHSSLDDQNPLDNQLKPLLGKVLTVLKKLGIEPPFPPDERKREVDGRWRLNRISFLSRQYFDCQFVVVQHAEPDEVV